MQPPLRIAQEGRKGRRAERAEGFGVVRREPRHADFVSRVSMILWYLLPQQMLCFHRAHQEETGWDIQRASTVRTYCIAASFS
jgi:hypothetical protein